MVSGGETEPRSGAERLAQGVSTCERMIKLFGREHSPPLGVLLGRGMRPTDISSIHSQVLSLEDV